MKSIFIFLLARSQSSLSSIATNNFLSSKRPILYNDFDSINTVDKGIQLVSNNASVEVFTLNGKGLIPK